MVLRRDPADENARIEVSKTWVRHQIVDMVCEASVERGERRQHALLVTATLIDQVAVMCDPLILGCRIPDNLAARAALTRI